MKKLRTAIIGCGGIAQVHERVLESIENVEIAACVDIIPERAVRLAEKCGARAYADLEGMLAAERPDTVHLCTPHALHVPQAGIAAEAGAAIFTEKPPAVSREQWAELKKIGEKTPVAVCFQNRFNPNVLEAEKMLAAGEMGKIYGVRGFLTWRRDAGYYQDGWHGRWESEGGGTLINQAIHTLDLLIRFLGRPDEIRCTMANHHLRDIIPEEDTVELYLQAGEKRGLLYASCAGVRDEPVILEIQAERGNLRLEEDRLEIRTPQGIEIRGCPVDPLLGKSYWGSGHRACIADFYEALRDGRTPKNNLASCEDTVEVLLQAYEQGKKSLMQD